VWGILIVPFVVPFNSTLNKWRQLPPIGIRLYRDSFSLLTILLATWLMVRFLDRRSFGTIGLTFNHFFKYLVIGSATGTIWLGVSLGIAWVFGWASPVSPIGFNWSVFAGTAISMFFNVIAQELLLCGFILQTIRRESNALAAILVSSILFAGYHAGAYKSEWLPMINVFAAGLLFCLAYITSGSLWFPIFIHYAWDVLVGPLLGLTESGRSDLGAGWKMLVVNGPILFTGGKFGLEGGLILIIAWMYVIQREKIRPLLWRAQEGSLLEMIINHLH
jgi:membrane protease YdiL (CAAX protease family)